MSMVAAAPGPALVLLPGLDGTGILFRKLVEALSGVVTSRVVSYPIEELLGYPELQPLVEAGLPKDAPFFLLGESFSGPLALRIAALHPTGLVGVVLCATFARSPHPYLPSSAAALARFVPRSLVSVLARGRAALGGGDLNGLAELFAETRRSYRPRVIAHRLGEVLRVDALAALRAVEVPILYLQGSRDWVVPGRNLRTMQAIRRDLTVVRIRGSHFLLQTRWRESAEAIRAFVARVPTGDLAASTGER